MRADTTLWVLSSYNPHHHLPFQGEVLFPVWGWQNHALACQPSERAQEKTGRTVRGVRKTSKCDCAVESCSPRFTVILGITTLFNNSGWIEEKKILQQPRKPRKWQGEKESNNTHQTKSPNDCKCLNDCYRIIQYVSIWIILLLWRIIFFFLFTTNSLLSHEVFINV